MKNALLTTAIVLFLNDEDGALRAITQTTVAGQSVTVSATYTETDDSGDVISPGAVWLSATGWTGFDSTGPSGDGLYDSRLHRIEYYWSITGPGDFTGRSDTNLPSSPAVFRDLSKQRGPRVVFPLSAAGTYNWTLFAVEMVSGKTATETGSFTTVSEDSAFPTTRTICFSPDNNFTGAPAGSTQVTTNAALQTAVDNAITATDTFRILLRRGETYAGTDLDLSWSTSFPNFRSGTYGSGAEPIATAPFSGSFFDYPTGAGSKHVWMGPLWWKGRWDTVNERGYTDGTRAFDATDFEGTFTTYGVKMTGIGIPLSSTTVDGTYQAHINCDFSDYRIWGLLTAANGAATNRNMAFVGCLHSRADRGRGMGSSALQWREQRWVDFADCRSRCGHHPALRVQSGNGGTGKLPPRPAAREHDRQRWRDLQPCIQCLGRWRNRPH